MLHVHSTLLTEARFILYVIIHRYRAAAIDRKLEESYNHHTNYRPHPITDHTHYIQRPLTSNKCPALTSIFGFTGTFPPLINKGIPSLSLLLQFPPANHCLLGLMVSGIGGGGARSLAGAAGTVPPIHPFFLFLAILRSASSSS